MKFQFKSLNKATAQKFQAHIKKDRNLDGSLSEKEGAFFVDYSIAEVKMPEKSKADMGVDCDDDFGMDDVQQMIGCAVNYIFQEMQYQMNWLSSEIDYISNALYTHVSNGHLPPINGADKMQKALNALGMADDYQVQKPVVYASTSRGTEIEIDFSHKK